MDSAEGQRRIIGLCGRMGSGKDTVGKILNGYGYERRAFADGVREEASLAFPELEDEIWAKPTSQRIRILLQWWGTEYRRHQSERYWLDYLGRRLGNDDKYVITDVRFLNEAHFIRNIGGEIWKISGRQSAGIGIDKHSSELVDVIAADWEILNVGSRQNLQEVVDIIMRSRV